MDNLHDAFCKARLGKAGKTEVHEFGMSLHANIAALRNAMLDGSVGFGPYHSFLIRDPKERTIHVAPFRDRVCHHALMNVCEPEFEQYLIHDSYACRKGKGMHAAVLRAQEFSRRFPWFLKLDIRKYYDSVDHGVLMAGLERRFKDRTLLRVFSRLVNSYHTVPGRGLPIGNLTSQHFANFYLGALDHHVKEELRIAGYVRYMDDMVLWGDNREGLKRARDAVRQFADGQLRLELKEGILVNRSVLGLPFLGVRVYPRMRRLTPRSKWRFLCKFAQYEKELRDGSMCEREAARRVTALFAFVQFADTRGLRLHAMRDASEGHEPRDPRRQLEQQREELPVCEPEQQHA